MEPETKDIRSAVRQALASHKNGAVTVLSSLLAVEDAIGYIPPAAIEEVAESTRSTINDVWGIASFYTNFRFTPPGKHVIEVCWGPSCHIQGAKPILKQVLSSLGLQTEGDTPDGQFTFKYNTCLGACAQAPVTSIDHHLLGRATPSLLQQHIEELRAGAGSNGGHGGPQRHARRPNSRGKAGHR